MCVHLPCENEYVGMIKTEVPRLLIHLTVSHDVCTVTNEGLGIIHDARTVSHHA